MPLTVCLEGNIAAGKTLFLETLSRSNSELNKRSAIIMEPVEQWKNLKGSNMLDLFYRDTPKYSSLFQSYVMLTMLENHRHPLPVSKDVRLLERSIYSGRGVFTELLYQNHQMDILSYNLLDEWYQYLTTHDVPIRPDLIIYLHAPSYILFERIIIRARKEERAINPKYLIELNDAYDQWLIKQELLNVPIYRINTDKDLNVLYTEFEYNFNQINETLTNINL